MRFLSKYGVFVLSLLVIFTYCKRRTIIESSLTTEVVDSTQFYFNDTIFYAKGFHVENYNQYKEVSVFAPNGKDTLATYILALHNTELPDSLISSAKIIRVPCQSIACLSATHIGALATLNLRNKIIAASSLQNIWDGQVQESIKKGEIVEISRGMSVDMEKIAALAPDILMQSTMDKVEKEDALEKVGTLRVYNNEWKENSLLARAEWLKFVSLFFCKNRTADSLFRSMKAQYKAAKQLALQAKTSPTLLWGGDYKGIWYTPQAHAYSAKALEDANIAFQSAGEGTGSTPLSFEQVIDNYQDADYWLSMQSGNIQNLKQLGNLNERYKEFKAFQTGKVFINNKREKLGGGNDFWESGVYHPDLLLKDLIKIAHPEILPDYEMVYWKKLDAK